MLRRRLDRVMRKVRQLERAARLQRGASSHRKILVDLAMQECARRIAPILLIR